MTNLEAVVRAVICIGCRGTVIGSHQCEEPRDPELARVVTFIRQERRRAERVALIRARSAMRRLAKKVVSQW